MAEYIEREALDNELQNLVREYNRNCESDKASGAFEALYRLRLSPTVDVVPRAEYARDLEALEKTVTEIYNRYVFEDNDYAEDDVAIEAVMNALTDVTCAIYELKEKYTKGGEE